MADLLSPIRRRAAVGVSLFRHRLGREEGSTRALLAALCGVAFVALLVPRGAVAFPERVVFAPGLGWVDAADVPGLPVGVADGAVLAWAVEGGAGGPAVPVSEAAVLPPEPAPHRLAVGAPVSLNEASLAELESLPGVGPVMAARIVAARPFRSVEQLDSVNGVGPKSYARLAPLVRP